MVKRLVHALAVLAMLLHGAARAAVTLDITPDPAVANQSVELSFRVTGNVDADPDFSPLEKSFEILGRNRQTTMSWINGNSEQSTTWVLNCMPRGSGRIAIPAISFGSQTSTARELDVGGSPAPASGANDDADIMLKVSASPTSPYVQQQVVYTVKLLHRVELSNPRLSQPSTSSDAVVKPLTNGRQFTEEVNGRTYDGYEIKYVVFAQKSGKLRIAPLSLTTEVVVGHRSVFDPFAQSLSTKRIEAEAVELNVKPVPASFPPGATWLPAKRLRLHEEWEPDVNSAEVGAPLTRTIFLWVDGLLSGQLPTLKLAAPAGIKLYPDQPQTNDQDTANGYTAVSQQKFAIIASQAGEAQFDEMSVPWWNVDTDQLEIARLPARALTINAAPGAQPPAVAPPTTPTVPATPATGDTPAIPTVRDATPWRAIALLMGLAWLLTLALWWRSRHAALTVSATTGTPAAKPLPPPHTARAKNSLKSACAADDASGARDALLAWAESRGQGAGQRHSLRDLARSVSAELASEISSLERHLYGLDAGPWRGQALWLAFQREPQTSDDKAESAQPLPKLFKLGTS
jgi:hypothetical protein